MFMKELAAELKLHQSSQQPTSAGDTKINQRRKSERSGRKLSNRPFVPPNQSNVSFQIDSLSSSEEGESIGAIQRGKKMEDEDKTRWSTEDEAPIQDDGDGVITV